ncbi:MAG: hypothetical protein ACOY3I_06220 [Verrucomicrobiota bacterium]
MKRIHILLSFVFLAFVVSSHATTAFQARDIAKREVNDQAKDKLIEIYGAKSSISVTPSEWQVLFYDPYAKQDGRLMRVANGGVVAIEQGYTRLDEFRLAAYKLEEVINPKLLKIDSNKVLEALSRSTPLRRFKVSAMEMRLRKPDKGDVPPVWTVTIFSVNARTRKEVELGTARVSAATGQIFELEIDTKKME